MSNYTPPKKVTTLMTRLEVNSISINKFLTENESLTQNKHKELAIKLENYDKVFNKLDAAVDAIEASPEFYTELEEFLAKCYEIQASASTKLSDYESVHAAKTNLDNTINSCSNSCSNKANIKLPEIKLPTFDGDILNWLTFKNVFEGLVVQSELPNSSKFYYLSGALKGDAKNLLHNLPITDSNFNVAWELLKQRYDSPRSLVARHLNSILKPPQLVVGSANSLRNLIDFYRLHVNAIKGINQETSLADLLLIALISKGLPSDILKLWELSLSEKELPTFDSLLEYLELHQRSLGVIDDPVQTSLKFNEQSNSTKFASNNSVKNKAPTCPKCKSEHLIKHCHAFLDLTPKNRQEFINKVGRCVKCFNPKTTGHSCNFKCAICARPHHKLLHFGENPPTDTHLAATIPSSVTKAASSVLIPTAKIACVANNGKVKTFVSLLDTGSSVNLITRNAAASLNLPTVKTPITISGISSNVMTSTHSVTFAIRPCNINSEWSQTITCAIVSDIPRSLCVSVNTDHWNLPTDIVYADNSFEHSKSIDLLLGAGVFFDILLPGQRKGFSKDLPVLQDTELGWIVAGKIPSDNYTSPQCNLVQIPFNLPNEIKTFWEIEEVTPTKLILDEEEVVESHFMSTHYRDSTGRYTVRLPTNTKLDLLGDSRAQATKRLLALEKRFIRDPSLKKSYHEFIHEYIELGHMQPALSYNDCVNYYMPHHGVLKKQ